MKPTPSRRSASRASKPRQHKKELRREKDARMDAACGPLGPVADAGWAGDTSEERLVASSAMPNETDTARVRTPRAALPCAWVMCSAAALAVAPAAMAATYAPCIETTTPPSGPGYVFTSSIGSTGAHGPDAGFDGPGHAGQPGGAGSNLSYTATAPLNLVGLFSQGGNGGTASDASQGNPEGSNGGGVGVLGGAGGNVGLTIAAPISLPNPGVVLPTAVCAYSAGGTGGEAGLWQDNGPRHVSGSGGAGGDVSVTNSSPINSPAAAGIIAESVGGNGANGKSVSVGTQFVDAGAAGAGAPGGTVSILNTNPIASGTTAILAVSLGGDGGTGGDTADSGVVGKAGSGGNGGVGGTVSVTNSGVISTTSGGSPAIYAYSFGGLGGSGGSVGKAASGGTGGNGGTVQINLGGTMSVAGRDGAGVLAQSFGGQGASGGSGNSGGAGGSGGDGGQLIFTGQGVINVGSAQSPQTNSQGILGQSIGGGGGSGGDVDTNGPSDYSIGGNGGVAANGGPISMNIGTGITTYGDRGQGILMQSIGGGGGNGGNASGTGTIFHLSIGGSGAGGGSGGPVTASSGGVVETNGEQAPGMLLQSIGEGGGSGGAAVSKTKGSGTLISVGVGIALGGSGAGGGNGGDIAQFGSTPTNTGIIYTTGSESTGILAQSIGGGGGKGGPASGSASAGLTNISVSLSYLGGGSGAGGGNGGNVTLQNSGFILATGAGSRGLFGQSIGGGGGDSGDASALAAAAGISLQPHPIVATIAFGGMSGAGGTGGPVTLTNSGLIETTGADADGMLGQSIGGGGGTSGVGDSANLVSASVTATLGSATQVGSGVTTAGGNGGAVSLTNNDLSTNVGSILTLGDGAAGMLAQSIGDGGGRIGGGAQGVVNGGSLVTTVSLGASAGTGSSTGVGSSPAVQVVNNGAILTFGADAPGILAQSIGGGGGVFGKGASSLGFAKSTGDGGNGSSSIPGYLGSVIYGGVGLLNDYSTIDNLLYAANQLLGVSYTPQGSVSQQLADLSMLNGSSGDSGIAASQNIAMQLGAVGSAVGSGGNVQVTNNGAIVTAGRMSTGLLAQSIGDGGGVGGVTYTASASDATSTNINLGGRFTNGNGQLVTVDANSNSNIYTAGSLAPGIVAQSVGGGGGLASLSADSVSAMKGLTVELGGVGFDPVGLGGDVTVTHAGNIQTSSHDSPGIIAQSIGGGGGLVRLLANDLETSGGIVPTNQSFAYNLNVGGVPCANCNDGGDAGAVTVTETGIVSTQGNDAHGILAQSIGGGGGAVLGGNPAGSNFLSANSVSGNGGPVTVVVGNGSSFANIYTTGQGASAILAQSIGGGGGLAGDFGLTMQRLALPQTTQTTGNGGPITITENTNAELITTGNNAPVIFAQSIGGGGGRIVNAAGAYDGSFGGTGNGGTVTINIGGTVDAVGVASPGIYAESIGKSINPYFLNTGSPITVTLQPGSQVMGGVDSQPGAGDGAAIYLVGGGPSASAANVITVQKGATITSNNDNGNGTAIWTTSGGYTQVVNAGTISGAIELGSGTCSGCPVGESVTNVGAHDSAAGNTLVHNESTGVINGSINLQLNGGNGSVQNDSGGQLNPGTTLAAALVSNQGTLDVGGASAAGARTEITGDLTQGSSGRIVIDSDHVAGVSDRLTVDGNATLAGNVVMRPTRLSNSTVDVMDVQGTLDASQLQVSNPYLVNYTLASGNTPSAQGNAPASGQSLYVTPHANFAASAAGLSANAQSLANHLQANFDSGASANALGTAFAQLANGVQNHAAYKAALNTLGNETQQAVGTAALAASHAFVDRMYTCPTFDGPTDMMMHEHDCGWGRVIDSHTSSDGADGIGYNANTYAMQFGGQHGLGDGWFVGGSVAYGTTSLDGSDGVGGVNGHGPQLGVMLKKEMGRWTISGGADASYGWYDSTRNVMLPGSAAQAKGDFNTYEAGLHSRIAYTIPMDDWYMKPYLDVHVVHFHTGSYTEQGAGALDLAMNSSSGTTVSASPIFEVGGRWNFANGMVLRPDLGVGAVFHDRDHWATNAQFVGSAPGVAPFTVVSSAPSALAKVKLDLNLSVSKNTELKLEYGGQFGSGYRANEGIVRVNHLF